MAFEYGEQKDSNGKITHAGSWGIGSTPKAAFEKIIENFRALKDDDIINPTWSKLLKKPTTLAGYGITDAYTRPQVDASFAPAGYGLGTSCKEVTGDWNKILITGFYQGNNLTNAPTNGSDTGDNHWYFVQVYRHLDTYTGQIAIGFGSSPNKMWFRRQHNGTWQPWKEILTTDIITNIVPSADNTYKLGSSTYRWQQIYAATATINTSDRNAKTDILDTTLGLDFIRSLRPVEFKYKVRENKVTSEQDGTETVEIEPATYDDEGNVATVAVTEERPIYKEVVKPLPGIRTHVGLIAQEVETVLEGKDIGLLTKDNETGQYGLRYEEFIAPLIKAIQELSFRADQQAAEIAALKQLKLAIW